MALENLTVSEEKPDLLAIRAEGEALAQSDQVAVAERAKEEMNAALAESLADQIEGALSVYAHPVLESQAPDYASAYGQPQIRQISEAAAKVCVKRGWLKNGLDAGLLAGRWGPELALIIAAVTPAALVWWAKSRAAKDEKVEGVTA
jgi:hypothetical protein